MKGTVKWFNNRKGYGFIQGENGIEVFIHRNELILGTTIDKNDRVEYGIKKSEKGPEAIDVKKIRG